MLIPKGKYNESTQLMTCSQLAGVSRLFSVGHHVVPSLHSPLHSVHHSPDVSASQTGRGAGQVAWMSIQHYPKSPNLCFFAFGHHSLSLTLALMSESAELHYFTKKDPSSSPGVRSSNGVFCPTDPPTLSMVLV